MALFLRQDDNRSELQRRIAAELRDKAKKRAELEEKPVDGVEDSAYLKGTKRTTTLAAVWMAIVVLVIGLLIWLLFSVK